MATVVGYEAQSIGIKSTGTTASVPKNCNAQLMYYLSCVNSCLPDLDAIPPRLLDYENYIKLDDEERALLFAVAYLFEPKCLNDARVFFLVDDDFPYLDGM